MVNPWEMTTRYPYNAADTWFVPPESPFLETLTALTFLAGVTERISLGASVIVLPYRHPLFTARVATSIDTLSKGRLILGVGIGWRPAESGFGQPLFRSPHRRPRRAGAPGGGQLEGHTRAARRGAPAFRGRRRRAHGPPIPSRPLARAEGADREIRPGSHPGPALLAPRRA